MESWDAGKILHLIQAIGDQVRGATNITSAVKKIPGLEKSDNELLRRLFEESSYSKGPTKSFEMMELDVSREKTPTDEKQISPSLSLTLMLEENLAVSFWKNSMGHVHSTVKDNRIPIDSLIATRNQYFLDRNDLWMLLEELIKIDMDAEHPYHKDAKDVLEKLVQSDILGTMIKHLEKLVRWRPISVDNTKVYSLFGTADIQASFICKHLHAWIMEYLEEMARFLDTLILLLYHERCNMSGEQLYQLLSIWLVNDFSHIITTLGSLEMFLTTSEIIASKHLFDLINFKFVLFMSTCLQLWRDYSPATATGVSEATTTQHYLIEHMSSDIINQMNKLFYDFCSCYGKEIDYLQSTKLIYANTIEFVGFLWKVFLMSNQLENSNANATSSGNSSMIRSSFSQRPQQKVYVSDDIAIREEDVVMTMLSLTMTSLSARSTSRRGDNNAESELSSNVGSGGNHFVYCSVLQEIVNILIKYRTLAVMDITANDDVGTAPVSSSLLDIGDIITLVRYAYPSHCTDYFEEFLVAWKDEVYHQLYPLIRLVHLLANETMHCPTYFFTLMSILCSVSTVQKEVHVLLDQIFHVISVEKFEDLKFGILDEQVDDDEVSDANRSAIIRSGEDGSESCSQLRWLTADEWKSEINSRFVIGPQGRVLFSKGATSRDNDGTPNTTTTWNLTAYRQNQLSLGEDGDADGNDNNRRRQWLPRLTICAPSNGHEGFLLDVDEKEEVCTVKWNTISCDWWSVLMDYLISMKLDPFDPFHHHSQSSRKGGAGAKGMQFQSNDRHQRQQHAHDQDQAMIELIRSAFELQSAMLTSSIQYKTYFQYRWCDQYNRMIMLKIFKQADCLPYFLPLLELQQEQQRRNQQQGEDGVNGNGLHLMNLLFNDSRNNYCQQFIQQLQALGTNDEEIERIVQEIQNVYHYDILTTKTLSLTYTEFLAKHLIHLLSNDIKRLEYTMQSKLKAMNVMEKTTTQYEQQLAMDSLLSNMEVIQQLLQDDFELSYHFMVKLMKAFTLHKTSNTTSSGTQMPAKFDFWYKINQLANACGNGNGAFGASGTNGSSNASGRNASGYGLKAVLYSLCSTLFVNLNQWNQTSHLIFLQRYHSKVHAHLIAMNDSISSATESSPSTSVIGTNQEDIIHIQQEMNNFLSSIIRYTGEELLILNVVDNNSGNVGSSSSSLLVTAENSVDYLSSMKALFQLVQSILVQCQQNYGEVSSLSSNVDGSHTGVGNHVSVGMGSIGLLSSLDYLITHTQCLELFYQYATLLTSWVVINQAIDHTSSRNTNSTSSNTTSNSAWKDLLSSRFDLSGEDSNTAAAAAAAMMTKASTLPIDYYTELILTKSWPFLEQLLPLILDVMELSLEVIHIISTWSMMKERLMKPLLSVVAMPMRTLSPLTVLLQQQQPLFGQSSSEGSGEVVSVAAVEQLTYFVALVSMLQFDLKIYQLKHVKQLRRCIMVVLSDLVPAFSSTSSVVSAHAFGSSAVAHLTTTKGAASLIDTIGNVNLLPISSILISALEANADNLPEQAMLWKLLSTFARHHPDILSIWFCNGNGSCTGGTKQQLANLLLSSLKSVSAQLSSSSASLDSSMSSVQMEVMTHLLSFCHQIFHYGKYYPLLAKVALLIASDEQYWKYVASPLKEESPRPPLEDLMALEEELKTRDSQGIQQSGDYMEGDDENEVFGNGFISHASVVQASIKNTASAHNLINLLTSVLPGIYDDANSMEFNKTNESLQLYHQRCKLITLVITLLSFERYGYFYDLDRMVNGVPTKGTSGYCDQAKKITQRVHLMYSQDLKVANRFHGWIRHFLHVHEEIAMFKNEYLEELSMRCQYFGFDFLQLCGSSSSPSMFDATSVGSATAKIMKQSIAGMVSLSLRSNVQVDDEIQQYLLAVRSLLNSLVLFQCHASITATDLTLLRHWREFLQLFVVPNIPRSIGSMAIDVEESPSTAGSLSPLVNGQASSPVSSKSSSFSGDKRSYEIVCEILKTITAPLAGAIATSSAVEGGTLSIVTDDSAQSSLYGLQQCNPIRLLLEMYEKSSLLMTMLHHQIKHIAFRASDPEKSVVQGRDVLGAIRLTPDKLNSILSQLVDLYVTMFQTPLPANAVATAVAANGGSPTTSFLSDVLSSSMAAHRTSESSIWMALLLSSHVPKSNVNTAADPEVIIVTKLRLKIQQRLLSTILLILTTLNEQPAASSSAAASTSSYTALHRGENAMRLFQTVSELLQSIAYHGGLALLFQNSSSSHQASASAEHGDHPYFDFTVNDLMILTKISLQVILQVVPSPSSALPASETTASSSSSSSSTILGVSSWLSLWEQIKFPGFMLEFVYFLQKESTRLVVEVDPSLMMNVPLSVNASTSSALSGVQINSNTGNHEFDKVFESIQRDIHQRNAAGANVDGVSSAKSFGGVSQREENSVKDVSSFLNLTSPSTNTSVGSTEGIHSVSNKKNNHELTAMLTMSYEILIKLVDGFSPWTHSAQQQEQQQQFYLTIIQVLRENAAFEKFLSHLRTVITFAASSSATAIGSGAVLASSSAKAASLSRRDLFALYLLEVNGDLLTTWRQGLLVLDHIFSKVTVKMSTSSSASSSGSSLLMPGAAQQLFDFFAYFEPIFLYPLLGTSVAQREQREQQQQQWLTVSQLNLISSTYQYLLSLSHLSPSQQAFDAVLMTASSSSASSATMLQHLLSSKSSSTKDSAKQSLSLSALTHELTSWLSFVFAGSTKDLMRHMIIFTNRDSKMNRVTSLAVSTSKTAATGGSDDKEKKRVDFGANQTFAFSSSDTGLSGDVDESYDGSSFLATPKRFGGLDDSAAQQMPRSILKTPRMRQGISESSTVSGKFTLTSTGMTIASTTPYMKAVSASIITVLTMLVKTISLVIASPFENETGDPSIEVGKSVFYLSEKTGYLCEGTITRLNKNDKTFDVIIRGVANNGHKVGGVQTGSPVTVAATGGVSAGHQQVVMSAYTPDNIADLTESQIRPKQVRYVNRPEIYFSRVASPSVLPAGVAATGAGANIVLSTGHLFAVLDQIDFLLQGASAVSQMQLQVLFQQVIYVTMYSMDHLSLAPIYQEIPEMIEQMEGLQQWIIRYADRLSANAGSRGPSGKDLAYCQYLLRWSEEIVYRLQRFLGVDLQPRPETPVVAGERLTKKSPKLKDKRRFDYSDEDCI